MKIPAFRFGLGLAALAFCLGAAALPEALAGQVKTVGGVPHVVNEGAPSQGLQTWKLQELWRAGGDGEDEQLFGIISAVEADDAGRLYLLDSQLAEVKVYSPDGEFVEALSRQGEGPGETQNPNDMALLPDGLIALAQAFPGKVVLIDKQGQPAGGFTIGGTDPAKGGFAVVHGMGDGGGNLVFGHETITQGESQTQQMRKAAVASHARDGALKATYDEFTYTFDFTSFVLDDGAHLAFGSRRFAVGPDGRVYVAPDRDLYAIKVFSPDGKLERVVERTVTPRARTEAEIARVRSFFEAATRQIPIETKIEIGKTEPPIAWFGNGLEVHPDGTLWVLSDAGSRNQPKGVMVTYDVFDAAGNFQRQVAMACPGDPDQDMLFFAGTDRVIVVTGFLDAVRAAMGGGAAEGDGEAAPMEVICYKVASRG